MKPPVKPEPTAGSLVRRTLGASVRRLLENEAGVVAGRDPEALHQARVAVRRLRSDMRCFRALVDREWAAPFRQELKWLGAELGAVRDLDVLHSRLCAAAAGAGGASQPGIKAILDRVRALRRTARKRLLAALRSDRYVALRERLRDAPRSARLTLASRLRASQAFVPIVRSQWKRLSDAVDELPPRPGAAALHRIRILAKRCRYAAEAAAPVVGDRAERFADAVAAVQDALGDNNDAEVACGMLRRLRASSGLALGANALLALETEAAARARARWREAWQVLDRKALRAWL